jgi:hypothetical protein
MKEDVGDDSWRVMASAEDDGGWMMMIERSGERNRLMILINFFKSFEILQGLK